MLTKGKLSGQPGALLLCSGCMAEWSADRRDYWRMDDCEHFSCECGGEVVEAVRSTTFAPV